MIYGKSRRSMSSICIAKVRLKRDQEYIYYRLVPPSICGYLKSIFGYHKVHMSINAYIHELQNILTLSTHVLIHLYKTLDLKRARNKAGAGSVDQGGYRYVEYFSL